MRDRRTLGGTLQTEFRSSMADLGKLPAIPANLLCDEHGQDEAKHGQDGAQDGQDGAQDGQDEVPDGQDEAQHGRRGHRDRGLFFHVQNEWISDVKKRPPGPVTRPAKTRPKMTK